MHISYWFIGVGCWRKLGRPAPWVRLILIIELCDLDSFAFAVVDMGAAKKPPFKGFFMGYHLNGAVSLFQSRLDQLRVELLPQP